MTAQFIKGKCEEMCPESEVKLRIKEHLLHFYETKPRQKNAPYKLVKEFSRSAAGIKAPEPSNLRTTRALKNTVGYLLKDIILDKRKDFNYVYDFVFDRLRSVRQEIVIQNLDTITTIELLEPIIMFLCYSSYRLCEKAIDDFDPKICNQHTQECLKKILCCYDELDSMKTDRNISQENNRVFMEAIYQIFNLGSLESLQRSLVIPDKIRKNSTFILTQSVSMQYFKGNYYRTLCLIEKLPNMLCAIASLKIQQIRHKLYQHFSYGFSSKQLVVPFEFIKKILFYGFDEEIVTDCQYYGIEIIEKNNVKFNKNNFDITKSILKSRHENFVDEKLKAIYLPEILLLKKL